MQLRPKHTSAPHASASRSAVTPRLLDYPLEDGCNARVWVQIPVLEGWNEGVYAPTGTQLLTRVGDELQTLCLKPDDPAVGDLLARGALVFETMHDAWLYPEFNAISFFVQKDADPVLDVGERSVFLEDQYVDEAGPAPAATSAKGRTRKLDRMREGDILIFETIADPNTGLPLKEGADPLHRHVLRVKTIRRTVERYDDGSERPVVEVSWDAADAPQLPFVLKRRDATGAYHDITVAHGNIVLADHGRTVSDEVLPPVPAVGRYNPPLLRRGLTFHASYQDQAVRRLAASSTVVQDPRAIVPSIRLVELGTDIAEPERLRVNATPLPDSGKGPQVYRLAVAHSLRTEQKPESVGETYRIKHVGQDGQPASRLSVVDQDGDPTTLGRLVRHEAATSEPPLPDLVSERRDIRSGQLEFVPISASTGASDLIGIRTDGRVVVKYWEGRGELMGTSQRTREFVVEVEDDGRAFLRFGFGDVGWEPSAVGAPFRATYRVGIGTVGNVGPNAIRHIVTGSDRLQQMFDWNSQLDGSDALRIRNFLPAVGGRDPAPVDTARLEAPAAMQVQERCVTVEDYADRAMKYADVEQAVARMHRVGSWQAVFIYVRRSKGLAIDAAFRGELAGYFERFRMIGHQVEVLGPRLAPLWVEIHVYLQAGHHATKLAGPLAAALGCQSPPDGPDAFFDPAGFKFGQTFYRSQLVARAMQVDGVARIEVQAFCQQSERAAAEAARQPDTATNKLPAEEEIKLLREEINLREVELAHLDTVEIDWLGQPGAAGEQALNVAATRSTLAQTAPAAEGVTAAAAGVPVTEAIVMSAGASPAAVGKSRSCPGRCRPDFVYSTGRACPAGRRDDSPPAVHLDAKAWRGV